MDVNKKKILYVVEAMGGGVFTYIVDLANKLVDEFDMYIAYAVRPQTPNDYKKYFDCRVHLIEVKSFCREINIINDVKAVREIKTIEEKIKPDIIHLHSSKAGAIGRIAFDGKKMPLFYTPHGYGFLMTNYKPAKRKIIKMIETILAKRQCTTISCSLGEHQETLRMTRNAIYINNAVNVEKLRKSLEKVKIDAHHQFTVFTLGRICYQKNPELFNSIAEAMPHVKFLWIGDGELRNQLKAPNIEITGWIEREEALKKSMNADVFILTSLWEGLPISLLEAMYMKKLCVVSNVIGNRDVIHNQDNGYVCDTVIDFVNAIEEQKIEYIDKAYRDLLENYETTVHAKRYAEVYNRVIDRWILAKLKRK